MNKYSSTKKTIISLFLSIILVTGTIAAISPSFMTNAQAQPYYGGGMDNNYEKSYGKDNRDKSKDIVNLKKVKCNNINVNINGQGANGNGGNGDSTNRNETNHGFKKFDNTFVCINNNNNTVVFVNETTPEPQAPACENCFTTILPEDDLAGIIADFAIEGIDSLQDICNFIDRNVQTAEGRTLISTVLFNSFRNAEVSLALLEQLLICLEQIYDVTFPRID